MRSTSRKLRSLMTKVAAGLAMTVSATTYTSSGCTDDYMTTQGQGFRYGNYNQGLAGFGYTECAINPLLPWC